MASTDPTTGGPTMLVRLRALLPDEWFPDDAPVLDGVLSGIAAGLDGARGQITYARAQTRIATATGFWLDLIAYDFFAEFFRRRRGETDERFRPRLLAELLRPRNTRAAIIRAVSDLTGKTPDLFEPWHPGDCGAYDIGTLAFSGDPGVSPKLAGYDTGAGGYDATGLWQMDPVVSGAASAGAGCYGSYELPYQVFVRVHQGQVVFAQPQGIGGYDNPNFAYDVAGSFGGAETEGSVTATEIYGALAATKAAGVTVWTELLPN